MPWGRLEFYHAGHRDLDLVNGDASSIANLIARSGGDGISLRDAIIAANATMGADDLALAALDTAY